MIVNNEIRELISKRDNSINYLDQMMVTGERLSETIHSYARTELNELSGGEAYECRSSKDAEKTIQDNQKFSERIKTIMNDISRIDHPNSSNILNASTADLHQLLHENEEKIRSLDKESEEASAIHSRAYDLQKKSYQALAALRNERINIATALEKQKTEQREKAAGAKERTIIRKRQISIARWWLVIVALGLIASRLTTWGG